MKRQITNSLLTLGIFASVSAEQQPNIVLVMTDDQGYGDLGHTGHPYAKTPHIDALSKESINLTDFHVSPTCSPTRASLMTGRWANRTGVWHTINGRSLLRKNEVTFPGMLAAAGYETGIFGKWHLGDAYPFRPQDKGFTYTFHHGAGGVGQTPDVWNNDYFSGGYYSNGKIVKADGFCTDVFFDKANEFIKKQAEEKKPFLAYIATNAPHSPMLAPQNYLDMYKGKPGKQEAFYAMITNIDDNVAKTRALLKELDIYENTIFIFMTDNGSASGHTVYNANMKGGKNSEYDGGHRVPFIMHYPKKNYTKQTNLKTLTHVVDLAPTLLELCGVKQPESAKFDGISIVDLFDGKSENWPHRYVITDSQRVVDPVKWKKSAVMIQDWRLVNGKELYFMPDDPGQENNLATKHPDKVKELRGYYEEWWSDLEPGYAETAEFILGNEDALNTTLTAHDWISPKLAPWNQTGIRTISKNVEKKFSGYWAVDVEAAGAYAVKLYRWAPEANTPITAGLKAEADRPGSGKPYSAVEGQAVKAKEVVFMVGDKEVARKKVTSEDISIDIDIELPAGKQKIITYFILEDGKELGVTYAQFMKK